MSSATYLRARSIVNMLALRSQYVFRAVSTLIQIRICTTQRYRSKQGLPVLKAGARIGLAKQRDRGLGSVASERGLVLYGPCSIQLHTSRASPSSRYSDRWLFGTVHANTWNCDLRIRSVPQREHQTSPLQRSTG